MTSPLASFLLRLWLAVTLLACGPVCGQEQSLQVRVDAYLAPFVKRNNFLGAVLVAKGDLILVNRAYGKASYELNVPNSPETRFHIASVSKPFTAASILLLQERGLLHVSDPVSRFLPDFPNGQKITLQHLLTHSSGITNVNNLPEYAAASRAPQTPSRLLKIRSDEGFLSSFDHFLSFDSSFRDVFRATRAPERSSRRHSQTLRPGLTAPELCWP